MKTKLILAVAALMICGSAMAQEQEQKKSGGFMKALKKGVESTTGLKVSDETLFVYPTIGEWKMQLDSCVGNRDAGVVELKIKVTKLMGDQMMSSRCLITRASVTAGTAVKFKSYAADPLYDFEVNKSVDVPLQTMYDVPADAKSLDVTFYIRDKNIIFEARRVPIVWK